MLAISLVGFTDPAGAAFPSPLLTVTLMGLASGDLIIAKGRKRKVDPRVNRAPLALGHSPVELCMATRDFDVFAKADTSASRSLTCGAIGRCRALAVGGTTRSVNTSKKKRAAEAARVSSLPLWSKTGPAGPACPRCARPRAPGGRIRASAGSSGRPAWSPRRN